MEKIINWIKKIFKKVFHIHHYKVLLMYPPRPQYGDKYWGFLLVCTCGHKTLSKLPGTIEYISEMVTDKRACESNPPPLIELAIEIDPDMKLGSTYEARQEPSNVKCLNGLYLHKIAAEAMPNAIVMKSGL